MTQPPEATARDTGARPPAASSCPDAIRPQVMRTRADFLAAARGLRQGTRGMMVQGRARGDGEATVRVGFTCSRKVGNAVARNRAKRRLREVARMVLPGAARPGWDYVLIGRAAATAERDFAALKDDFAYALRKLHAAADDT